MYRIASLCVAIMFSGCVEVGTALKTVNETLAKTNSALGGKQNNGKSGSPQMLVVEQDIRKVIKPLPNKEAIGNIEEALPVMTKALSTIACTGLESNPRVGLYATSDSYVAGKPIQWMHNHRSGCVNVERIDNYKKVANNAFEFNALYVSPQSGESYNGRYKMIKEPSGEWLFKF